ncbi:MAG: class II aldolase/adducin family protein [Pseudomonadota bacterium]|nr:class II aldolase/adducin family protein [Pseudomonadota bacterium]
MANPRPVRQSDGTWALVGPDGNPVTEARFRAASAYSDGRAVVHRFDGSAVLVDTDGREIPRYGRRFRWILPMFDGEAPACTIEGETGHIDRDGHFAEDALDPEWRARTELVRVSHLLYEKGYNVSIDGNVSWRLDDGSILITPAGAHLGFIGPEELVVVKPDGSPLRGDRPPTSEWRLHIELHRTRPECRCVVHAHSPYAIAASLAGVDLHKTWITAAPVPTTAYARISSDQSPAVLRPYMDAYNWAILPRHGVVAWADSAWDAFLRVEGLEHYAKILMTARACGPIEPLDDDKRIELLTFWGLEHLT